MKIETAVGSLKCGVRSPRFRTPRFRMYPTKKPIIIARDTEEEANVISALKPIDTIKMCIEYHVIADRNSMDCRLWSEGKNAANVGYLSRPLTLWLRIIFVEVVATASPMVKHDESTVMI